MPFPVLIHLASYILSALPSQKVSIPKPSVSLVKTSAHILLYELEIALRSASEFSLMHGY